MDVGFGTAACVWGALFGQSLSRFADGSLNGFYKTCCWIHQGHFPCAHRDQYAPRVEYWTQASTCLGALTSRQLEQQRLRAPRPSIPANVTRLHEFRAHRWYAEQQILQRRRFDL